MDDDEDIALLEDPKAKPAEQTRSLPRLVIIIGALAVGTLFITLGLHVTPYHWTSRTRTGRTLDPVYYSPVDGLFEQSLPETDDRSFDVWRDGATFGLISRDWNKLISTLNDLNSNANSTTSYKLLFVARHGEGEHNAELGRVGLNAWDCYWSLKDGDGSHSWADAALTSTGEAQAQVAHEAWLRELGRGAPLPTVFISSPLTRSASTLNITWSGVDLKGSRPVFREIYRESIGLHTCDRRRSRAYLSSTFSWFSFEPGFTEQDELWTADLQETPNQQANRMRKALDELFATTPDSIISITAHSGTVDAIFQAIGHRQFEATPGQMVPVVVQAIAIPSVTFPTTDPGPSATAPPCTSDPNPSTLPTTAPVR